MPKAPPSVRVHVCESCEGGAALMAALRPKVAETAELWPVACMSGCRRAATVAFRAPGKTAYLFGNLTAEDVPDLARFARLYAGTERGDFTDARVLGGLRHKALARIPG